MRSRWLAALCALVPALVFAWRWRNTLPFSGNMTVLDDADSIGFWGRYLIYAREPLSYPLGIVKGLGFPFEVANVADGSIPLVAILFKIFGKVIPALTTFYYFPLVEIVCVFLTGYFAVRLLGLFGVRSFAFLLMGAVLVGLSPTLLYRSSNFYLCTFVVMHTPVFLAFAYFYARMFREASWGSLVRFASVFAVAALIDGYLTFGLLILGGVCAVINLIEALWAAGANRAAKLRLVAGFGLAVIVAMGTLSTVGQTGNLRIQKTVSVLRDRYADHWGYGGGAGGGFHVADVLAPIVPPKDSDTLPHWKKGPTAHLAAMGFPLTVQELRDGQFEGFGYMGTVALLLLLSGLGLWVIRLAREGQLRLRFWDSWFLVRVRDRLGWGGALFLAALALFAVSWGYIIHVGGYRLNDLPTPGLMMALAYPKLLYARSLGRLVTPFTLALIVLGLVVLYRELSRRFAQDSVKVGRWALLGACALSIAHVAEIRGFLALTPARHGEQMAGRYTPADSLRIRETLVGKKAVMLSWELRANNDLDVLAYGLAFHSGLPISGSVVGLGSSPAIARQYEVDRADVLAGNLSALQERYGDVAIAATADVAPGIVAGAQRAGLKLSGQPLADGKVVLLTL